MKTVRFRTARRVISVALGCPSLSKAVADLFAPLLTHEERSDQPSDVFRIERTPNGFELFGTGERTPVRRFATLPGLLSELEHRITLAVLEDADTSVRLHAACVGIAGRAVIALGDPGAAKSSVALAWSVAGHPVLCDDIVLLDAAGLVRGVPRLIKIDHDRLSEHGIGLDETVSPTSTEDETWWDPRMGGGWVIGSLTPALVARIERDPSARGTRVTPLSPAATFGALLRHRLPGGPELDEAADRLVPLAESVRGVDVRFESSTDAAATLVAILGTP